MPRDQFILVLLVVILGYACAQTKWAWPKSKNQKILGYYPEAAKKVYYTDESYSRADREREREPTTKKPLPGEVANDDIDDYPDQNDETPTKQNSPYLPGGNEGFPSQFGSGFGGYPQFGFNGGLGGAGAVGPAAFPGNPGNGILVGPGGPTGIIGRPQSNYPGPYPAQAGYPGYTPYNTQPYAGSPSPNYSGYAGGLGQQYPINPYQQFAAGVGGQYPTAQYPGIGPQYTEGYGLAYPNPQQNGFNGFPGRGFPNYPPQGVGGGGPQGFDEYIPQTEGKSASVKVNHKKVDDKVAKNFKKL